MSRIKCPYCEHLNTGQIPFCTECGKVLPLGDEMEVMAETIGSNFALKWVFVGAAIILVLSSLAIFSFKAAGMDLSFMVSKESARLDDPGITTLTPEFVISPSEDPVSLDLRTMGNEKYSAAAARAVKICGETVPVITKGAAVKVPIDRNLLGITFVVYNIKAEESVSFVPPPCKKEGFYDVELKFESGLTLKRSRGIYYTHVSNLWYLFYTQGGLGVLGSVLSDKAKTPEELIDKYHDKLKSPTDDIIKRLNSIIKEDARMAMLSFDFWGLFLLELLAFFIGGLVASRLSPGITIKESLVAGVMVVILLVIRNVLFFGAGGSYMVFQLLIMFPTYASIATFGGYMGEKWQGVLPSSTPQG
ncbi:hypothetical protein KKF84_17560 [Myxococcota bacterium]|nr:hypothetical protein [Myxococcota bacterium]